MRQFDSVMQQDTDMLQSINIQTMLLLFFFGAAIAMLGMTFQAFMRPGQIFNWYALWLIKVVEKSTEGGIVERKHWSCDGEPYWASEIKGPHWFYKLIAKLTKPLGLCQYCNSTWIAIIFHLIYFGLSWNIVLLIGIVWFFVKAIAMIYEEK